MDCLALQSCSGHLQWIIDLLFRQKRQTSYFQSLYNSNTCLDYFQHDFLMNLKQVPLYEFIVPFFVPRATKGTIYLVYIS